jgi:uncharacterized membrane protein YjgN (DUF898 family)
LSDHELSPALSDNVSAKAAHAETGEAPFEYSPAPDSRTANEAVIEHRLQFVGSGSEYFRIWIVNLLFSILTLGIYSAWAKVRREQYFHRNTLLDGSGFDYHGNPKSILKGRLIAVAIIFTLGMIEHLEHNLYYPALILASPLIPWLLVRSFVFRARNTSFRGLHFNFHGTYKAFCRTFLSALLVFVILLWGISLGMDIVQEAVSIKGEMSPYWGVVMLLAVFALLLWVPALTCRFKLFQFNHLAFGDASFSTQCKLRSFYGVFLRSGLTALLMTLPVVLAVIFLAMLGSSAQSRLVLPVFGFITYLGIFLLSPPYLKALTDNLLWNNTRLGQHRFVSDQAFWSLSRLVLLNWLLIILTLGFYWPWAKVKMAAYRARHMAALVAGNLDDFMGGAAQEQNAVGEEIADAFDFDIAL